MVSTIIDCIYIDSVTLPPSLWPTDYYEVFCEHTLHNNETKNALAHRISIIMGCTNNAMHLEVENVTDSLESMLEGLL